jgi:ABC-type uncharacterized transport system substrate-binding protein
MKRREFITLIGGPAMAWPIALRAQQPMRMRRVGVLMAYAKDDSETEPRLAAFREALERFGWSEGKNVQIYYRYSPPATLNQASLLAKELVTLQPDVILAHSTPLAAALQRETRAIPVVFVAVNDPIGSGFIASLARPAGNLTGLTLFEAGISGKWLAMLKEIAPQLARAAFVIDPKTSSFAHYQREAEAIATSLAIELVAAHVEYGPDVERTIGSFAREPNGGLVVPPSSTTTVHRDLLIELAARHRLPAVYSWRFFVAAGGLMSYGIDPIDEYRQAASYVDRILRGANPAELPVQAPTKFETVLNLKTAKALGLTVPPGLLVAADEVIE